MTITAERVKAYALELRFIACGITDLAPTPHASALDAWLANGYAGTMRYLHRQAKKRKQPELIDPRPVSAVVVLDNYYSAETEADQAAPRVAKYARGEDYHRVTMERLDKLAAFLSRNGASYARSFSDAGPVPERELAQRAGLGWIGKNTMLVRPGVGSFFFIGSVFTDLALPADAPFANDHCGSCTRCLEACPTGAFVAPRVLDATRCISYLTIEHKGPIPNQLVPQLEGWAFGCDACNDACPWNQRFAAETGVVEFRPRRDLNGGDPEQFERMSEDEFARRFGDTPFARPGLARMRRNVRAALASVMPAPGVVAGSPAVSAGSD
ncbi:MAG: tRNA epoxyqueuosine(34) reductase QueG [Gemmatimonadales bacterium]